MLKYLRYLFEHSCLRERERVLINKSSKVNCNPYYQRLQSVQIKGILPFRMENLYVVKLYLIVEIVFGGRYQLPQAVPRILNQYYQN